MARKPKSDSLAALFLAEARGTFDRYERRIARCLALLSDEEIWWRPNSASNSVGNLVLHLCGNVRQWIIAGVGQTPDVRERDKEFAQREAISRTELLAQLRTTMREANRVLDRVSAEDLAGKYSIQGFRLSGLNAISHVYEHFSHHAGQIIYVTKMKRGKDLHFTHLPLIKKRK
jgi:uncharacterized damage-inducible protein DinB